MIEGLLYACLLGYGTVHTRFVAREKQCLFLIAEAPFAVVVSDHSMMPPKDVLCRLIGSIKSAMNEFDRPPSHDTRCSWDSRPFVHCSRLGMGGEMDVEAVSQQAVIRAEVCFPLRLREDPGLTSVEENAADECAKQVSLGVV